MKIAVIVLSLTVIIGIIYFSVGRGGPSHNQVSETSPEAAPRDPEESPESDMNPVEGENFIEEENGS